MKTKFRIVVNAPVVIGFAALMFAATLAGFLSGGYLTGLLFQTSHSSLLSPLTWLRAFTHVIGHHGWSHFMGNVSYILLLGPMLEEKYGSTSLIKVIVITAVVTSIIHYIFFPGTALCGASGVVFAFILLTSFTGFNAGEIPLTFLLVAAIYIGQQVYEGIFVQDTVSQFSHILGGIVGGAAGYLWNRK